MAKQLNIFDVEPEMVALDLTKAHVKKTSESVTYTDVLIHVPRNATSDKDYETWDHICYCLWKRIKGEWDEVLAKVDECRRHREPVEIRIPIHSNQAFFTPMQVVKYL
jgi:hypothetical protein